MPTFIRLLEPTVIHYHVKQHQNATISFYPNVTTLRSGLCCRSSVCRHSVKRWCTLLRLLNLSAKFLRRCVRWPSSDLRAKFYGDSPRGTPPSGALNARGVSKYSDFGPIEGYIS